MESPSHSAETRRLSPGLVVLQGLPWALVRLRKPGTSCHRCARPLVPGADAYRPLGERGGVVRGWRHCPACIDTLLAAHPGPVVGSP